MIKLNNAAKLIGGLALRGAEKKYFLKLIDFVNSRENVERDELEFQLYQLRKYSTHTELNREAFKLISEWHHFAIAALTRHQDFRNDPVWISQKLVGKIKPEQVAMAIQRLLQAGVLELVEGKLVMPAVRASFWTALADVEMQVLFHQRQVLHLAMQEVMKPEIKNIAESAFMTIDSTKLIEAQSLVREFRAELAQLLEKNPGDSTYALTIQLFPVVQGHP